MKKIILTILLLLGTVGVISAYLQLDRPKVEAKQMYQLTAEHLSPAEFQKALASGSFMLIDIRTIEEYNAGHLKGSIQNDYHLTEVFTQYLQSLDKTKAYLIYCRSGNRSGKALAMMKKMGFTKVADLEGGINAWTAANLPVER